MNKMNKGEKMKEKKVINFIVFSFIILFFSSLYFYSSRPQKQMEEERITLKWYINFSWFQTEWGQNIVSKRISEKTGVDIEFVVPKGNEKEKLQSMISSNSLPDFVTIGWWESENQELVIKEQVYALNELDKQYQTGFMNVAKKESVRWYTNKDGNLYGYPNYSYTWNDFKKGKGKLSSNQNFLVRKDIYEAIGSPDMTTMEGFESAVKKAKEYAPFINGKPLIPIGADEFTDRGNNSFDIWLQNFLAVPYEKNGIYYDRNMDTEYIKWLKLFRKLREEGYINDEVFIDNRVQLMEKLEEGRYFCLLYQNTDIEDQQKQIYNNNPEQIYIPVEGPRNSKGEAPKLPITGIQGWTLTYISKNCKNPQKAMEVMAYMLSPEGKRLLCFGEKDSMYSIRDNQIVVDEKVLKLLNTNRTLYDKIYGAYDTYWMLQDGNLKMNDYFQKPKYMERLYEWTHPYIIYSSQYELEFQDNQEMNYLYNGFRKLWSDTLIQLLLSNSEEEFDEIIEKYLKQREEKGYQKFVIEATKTIQKNKEKLGMEE